METGGLLLWAFLTENIRELKHVNMENYLNQMREISRKKSGLREIIIQQKETVEDKQKFKEEVHEIILKLEANIFSLQEITKTQFTPLTGNSTLN